MRATVELPESVYRRTEQAAHTRGLSVDELISDVLERELGVEPGSEKATQYVSFPILHSKNPGSLDLSNFDFDDLLA
jgi:hypothetical protein